MKTKDKIILLLIVMGLVCWVIGAEIRHFIDNDISFLDALIFKISHYDLYMRTLVIGSYILFGLIVSSFITKLEKAEEKVEKAYSDLKQVFNTPADGMCVISNDFKILCINDTFTKLLGIRKNEVVDKKCYEVINGSRCNTPEYPMAKIINGEESVEYEETIKHRNGTPIPCIVAAMPFRDSKGNLTGIVEDIKDITEIKQSGIRLNRLVGELKGKNSELEDFAYIVSHDLKAPLRAIGTLSEWISADYSDKLNDEGKEQLNLLNQRVKRMHNLIESILKYSRVERHREEKEPVPLNVLLPEVIDMIAPPENIEVKIETEMPEVFVEKTRIRQVFENLLSNAVKFMDKPKGEIRIGCVADNGFWRFSVADNGPGIEKKYFEKIFKIFQMLKPRDEFESTGIGLTLVKKIITMYGGEIRVESKIGEGSTFRFTLPNTKKNNQLVH